MDIHLKSSSNMCNSFNHHLFSLFIQSFPMRMIITVTSHSPSELFSCPLIYHDHLSFVWSLSSLRRFSFMLVDIRGVRFDSSGWSERPVESIWPPIIQMVFFHGAIEIHHSFSSSTFLNFENDVTYAKALRMINTFSWALKRCVQYILFLSYYLISWDMCLFYNVSSVNPIRQHLPKYVFVPTYYFFIYVEYVSFRLCWQ